jgi:uncharacterized protein (DUF2147 family)
VLRGAKLCIAVVLCAVATAALANPHGLWRAKDGAKVRVSSCGRALCGTMAATASRLDPETGRPWTDKHNADARKRGRYLIGVRVFSMVPNGAGRWSGKVYNVDDGQSYDGHLIEVDARTIRIEGCALGVCGGETMARID